MQISKGFALSERATVARLYWQAFGAKLGRVMRPERRALAFFETVLDPDYALIARDDKGGIQGVAGFKTANGGLAGGELSDLRAQYGLWGGLWRGVLLSSLERDLEPGVFLMDGICVDANARGQGVGSALLNAIFDEARVQGATSVRLDVIDTNPRARALYERMGFVPKGEERTGPLQWLFGFNSATRMELVV